MREGKLYRENKKEEAEKVFQSVLKNEIPMEEDDGGLLPTDDKEKITQKILSELSGKIVDNREMNPDMVQGIDRYIYLKRAKALIEAGNILLDSNQEYQDAQIKYTDAMDKLRIVKNNLNHLAQEIDTETEKLKTITDSGKATMVRISAAQKKIKFDRLTKEEEKLLAMANKYEDYLLEKEELLAAEMHPEHPLDANLN